MCEPETLRGLARRTGLPASWLRAEVEAGRIPALRAGRRILFHPDVVNEVLLQRAAMGHEAPDQANSPQSDRGGLAPEMKPTVDHKQEEDGDG